MSWLRIDDGLPFDAKVMLLGRTKRERNEAIGAAVRIWAWCAQQRTDGFVPAAIVAEIADQPVIGRLCRKVFDRAALLHRRGEACDCLAERSWPDGADYLVHDYLQRNPSRAENDVARAKRRELRDRELRAAVRARDADRCRYCARPVNWADRRSSRGGVLDHVVPDRAAGADNLVVACRGCNTRKRDRTPEAAGMRLLPAPGEPDHDAVAAPPVRPAGSATDQQPINAQPATDHRSDHRSDPKPDLEPITDPAPDPGADPPAPPAAPARTAAAVPATSTPQRGIHAPITDPTRRAATDGPGRDGTGTRPAQVEAGDAGPTGRRPTVGPPDTPRTASYPNPYLRQTITGPGPDDHAGHPPPQEPPT